ncbi:uncharacterized protein CTRU02_203592 [Colletotrichum truncatum]|uniref:Uncharacterized protein n=1 Tax=Colletotrichum truncatum TaxID=5467 RepID=A0ACC3Z9N7_COLTU
MSAKRGPRSAQGSGVPLPVVTQVEAAAKGREEVGSESKGPSDSGRCIVEAFDASWWRLTEVKREK